MLTGIGYPVSVEENIKRFTGMDGKAVRDHILNESGVILTEELVKKTMQEVNIAMESELLPLNVPVMESAVFKDIAKCIASNAPRDHILKSLHITQQNHYFDQEHIFSASQVKFAKPAPDLFLFAAKQMGYQAKNCLVIEDSLVGIRAALAADMRVIGYLGGRHTHFDWYKDMVHDMQIPYAHNSDELLIMIQDFIKP